MEDITKHRQAIAENIAKAFGEDIEKAHKEGDIHPNGKWYWNSSANGGKGDWRVIRNKKGTAGSAGNAAGKTDATKKNSIYNKKLTDLTDEEFNKIYEDSKKMYHQILMNKNVNDVSKKSAEDAMKKLEDEKKRRESNNKKTFNTVTHDINGTKVTVTKNSDGSYTLEANGKKVKSDDPSYYVFGTNLKPRIKRALAQEVGLETKKKGEIPDESEVKTMM